MTAEAQIAGLERRLRVLKAGRKPCGSCSGYGCKEARGGRIYTCDSCAGTGFALHQPRHQGPKRDRQTLIRLVERQLAALRVPS